MSSEKIKYQNVNYNRETSQETSSHQTEKVCVKMTQETFQKNSTIFLLNNILMSVQFFENYERDVRQLRERWFKETSIESHHKKCFYADSLFRLSGANVKFSPRHGPNKSSQTSLRPFRIYVSNDNIEAAYDPSALGHNKDNVRPQYQFTVNSNEKSEKSGFVYLVKYEKKEDSDKSDGVRHKSVHFAASEKDDNLYQRRKSNSEFTKNTRRFTRTEKFISSQNKDRNSIIFRKSSVKYSPCDADDVLSGDVLYRFTEPKSRLEPQTIHDFRMNNVLTTSHEIPMMCFQNQDVKKPLHGRRPTGYVKTGENPLFKSQIVLNSAAFKGYFCDLLLERLSGSLSLDPEAVNSSSVLEEFIHVKQPGVEWRITPVIAIRDWKNFIEINNGLIKTEKKSEITWPSGYMQKVLHILPCFAVPVGNSSVSEENVDYEKEWKLDFSKGEEFLLLHMMHAHVRCYFFALLLYKSFIETEINGASFGPKHLMHLLFWRVQKNFLAWPEDRPGETLLMYLKTLYKKLQNKHLSDFFITSRNLFATSPHKDLHMVQTLVKRILENPVPFIIRAIRNLHVESNNFYPVLDTEKLYTLLKPAKKDENTKQKTRKKKEKVVHFEDDDPEKFWKKAALKQIEIERKIDEENFDTQSIESVKIDEPLNIDVRDQEKWTKILDIFLTHFIEMSAKSAEFNFPFQTQSYLSHSQKLIDLLIDNVGYRSDLLTLKKKLSELKENNIPMPKEHKRAKNTETEAKPESYPLQQEENEISGLGETIIKIIPKNENVDDGHISSDDSCYDDGLYETKL